jgi:hypothetical protein
MSMSTNIVLDTFITKRSGYSIIHMYFVLCLNCYASLVPCFCLFAFFTDCKSYSFMCV